MDNIKQNFSQNLINLRKEKNLTQLELAKLLNYSDKSVSKWENGETVPDIEVLKKIADYFSVSIDTLISDPNNLKHIEKVKAQPNKVVITLLSTLLVWIIATILYSLFYVTVNLNVWMCFVWALPTSFIVLIVFNAVWGKKKFSILLTSGLMWSALAAIYLQLIMFNPWQIFFIGIPLQLAIILWANLNMYKK
mgnify:CR=1 FL=1